MKLNISPGDFMDKRYHRGTFFYGAAKSRSCISDIRHSQPVSIAIGVGGALLVAREVKRCSREEDLTVGSFRTDVATVPGAFSVEFELVGLVD